MAAPKFKNGDLIRPIPGKKTSREIKLSKLIKLEVLRVDPESYGKRELHVKIREGSTSTTYRNYKPGDTISIYEDAFELCDPAEPEYEIF